MTGPSAADQDIWVEITTLPLSAQEQVYEQVKAAFGITEEVVEVLPPTEWPYWICLIEAASRFVPVDLDGTATDAVISTADLHELHAQANSADSPIHYLQRFADFAREELSRLSITEPDVIEPGALFPRLNHAFRSGR